MEREQAKVTGVELDGQTRCAHYKSPVDVVAIKMKCCGVFYACKHCHEELADHASAVWPRTQWNELAVLCGACATEMSISSYLACSNRCPNCASAFNPHCNEHYSSYFEC